MIPPLGLAALLTEKNKLGRIKKMDTDTLRVTHRRTLKMISILNGAYIIEVAIEEA